MGGSLKRSGDDDGPRQRADRMNENEDLIGLCEGLGDALVANTVRILEDEIPFSGWLAVSERY